MKVTNFSRRLADYYGRALDYEDISFFLGVCIFILPIFLGALLALPFVSVGFGMALGISFISAVVPALITNGVVYPHYWLIYVLPALVFDVMAYPFRLLYSKTMNAEVRGSRLLNSLIAGKIDKKKIQHQVIGFRANIFTKGLINSACEEIVRDQIGRDPLGIPNGVNVPRYERVEVMNEKIVGKIAYVHFEVECRTRVGSDDDCKGAHFFARLELSSDGMKIKKPDVTWVCDLDCEKTTPLELAEKFARFINEKDGDDLLSTHNPREFMRAAERGLVQSGEESAGSTSSRVGLESE